MLRISFFQQGSICDGDSVHKTPLGGTESAMIFMAQALAARGHEVWIFNTCGTPGNYQGVNFQHWKDFEKISQDIEWDIFICVRSMLPLLIRKWGKVQIYFSPDAIDQPFVNRALTANFNHGDDHYEIGLYSLRVIQNFVDAIFCVGQWQAATFQEKFKVPSDKVFIASNGVYLPHFSDAVPLSRRKKQIVYTSTPFRGLDHLLKYFPEIKREVPEATCLVMSGMRLYGYSEEEDRKGYQHIYQLADQPGVELLGPLPKPEMARRLQESRVMAYPNTFAETFCIAALEAQAAGLPIVTTRLAGLCERVDSGVEGFLIEGRPELDGYRSRFIQHVVEILRNDYLWQGMHEKALQRASRYSYDHLASHWERKFEKLLGVRSMSDRIFSPSKQSFHILVNGYPKQVELTSSVISKYLTNALRDSGFSRSADLFEGM